MLGSRAVLRLLSDENFNGDLLRGLKRRLPELDVIRVQDRGLGGTVDQEILEWLAVEERILLTHDRETMAHFAHQRVRGGQPMPGVFIISDLVPVGEVLADLVLAIECLEPRECQDRVIFFPLRD